MPTALPVSSAVDTFMQSADQSAMQAAVGGGFFTGAILDYVGTTAPDGWVMLNGQSIGSATSGASGRANADTASLYALIWNNYSDIYCPVIGGRGASAAEDFAADKPLSLLDATGRVSVPYLAYTAFDPLGLTLGEETHLLDVTEIPSHTHDYTGMGTDVGNQTADVNVVANVNTLTTQATGGGVAHNNIQPTLVIGCRIVKL